MSSLRGRVALAALAAAAIVIVVAGATLFATAGRDERRDLDRRLTGEAQGLAALGVDIGELEQLQQLQAVGPGREVVEQLERLVGGSGRVLQVLRDGRPIVSLGGAESGATFPGRKPGLSTVEVGGERWRSYTAPVDGAPDLDVQLLGSVEEIDRRAAARRRETVIAGAAALVLSAVLGFVFGGLATRPLGRLRDAAARVRSTGDLGERVPERSGPEEVQSLATSLNGMLARLEDSAAKTDAALEASRRFAADAGHELRTPLAGLRANVDVLARNPDMAESDRRELAASVRAELERLTATLEALQELARGDAGAATPFEGLDLAEIADAAVEAVRARERGVEVSVRAPEEGVSFEGSPAGLRSLLDNLLRNAANHGAGRVELTVEPGVRVLVDDDGPGVPAAERESIFGRFERGRGARGEGSGLGLAIVAQQARLHDGSVRVEDSPLGGARFVVELPQRRADEPGRRVRQADGAAG